MGTVVDLVSRLPVQIWFKENPNTSDTQFEADLLGVLSAKTLLILDRGFYHFQFWMQLIEQQVAFICRLKAGASYTVERVFTPSPSSERLSNQAGSQTQKCSPVAVAFGTGSLWFYLVQLPHLCARPY